MEELKKQARGKGITKIVLSVFAEIILAIILLRRL